MNAIKKIFIKSKINTVKKNVFKSSYTKKVLISFLNESFYINSQKNINHTNYSEVRFMAEVFHKLGFQVDVVHYLNTKINHFDHYDVVIGFGEPLVRSLWKPRRKHKTIYYGTGHHVHTQNHITIQRIKDFYQNQKIYVLESARIVNFAWTEQTTLVDGMIILGNDFAKKTYQPYFSGPIKSLDLFFYATQNWKLILNKRISQASPNHFLWMGSNGAVHKGLDLLIEIFSQRPDIHLHVCGDVSKEKIFFEIYKDKLIKHSQIHFYGHVDLRSHTFKNILEQCSFFIYPSCSEAGGGAILNAVANGALIPLITKQCSLTIKHSINIDNFSTQSVEKAIQQALSLSPHQIYTQSSTIAKTLNKQHSISRYKQQLVQSIRSIL